jgi:hypothetical protein
VLCFVFRSLPLSVSLLSARERGSAWRWCREEGSCFAHNKQEIGVSGDVFSGRCVCVGKKKFKTEPKGQPGKTFLRLCVFDKDVCVCVRQRCFVLSLSIAISLGATER